MEKADQININAHWKGVHVEIKTLHKEMYTVVLVTTRSSLPQAYASNLKSSRATGSNTATVGSSQLSRDVMQMVIPHIYF